MRCFFILSYFFLSAILCFGQNQSKKLEIKHLTGDFYIYTTCNLFGENLVPSNSLYAVTEKGVIMIDTPWDTTQFQPLLDSIWQKHHQEVVLCVATHFHEDRTGGFDFLRQKGIKTYSSVQTLALCKKNGKNEAAFTFSKDTTFIIGNHRFETFYAGEGHTPDNIVIWFEKEKILYGGCFIKSTESKDLGNLSDAKPVAWQKSIEALEKKYPKTQYVIPGHYSWKSKKSIKHTAHLLRKYLKTKA